MMKKLQIILVLGGGLGLAACNSDAGQTNDQPPVQNEAAAANESAAQPAIELPPGIANTRPYRCADGSTVYVDFLSDNKTANLRTETRGPLTKLKAAEEGGPFLAEGYSVGANANETEILKPGAKAQRCKS